LERVVLHRHPTRGEQGALVTPVDLGLSAGDDFEPAMQTRRAALAVGLELKADAVETVAALLGDLPGLPDPAYTDPAALRAAWPRTGCVRWTGRGGCA